jgi:PilZ domain
MDAYQRASLPPAAIAAIQREGADRRVVEPMSDHSQKTYAGDNVKVQPSTAAGSERRTVDRHLFTAAADVVEQSSGARFSTRTTDLSPGGCFVDTMLPFEADSKVRVTIRNGKAQFEANGQVIYSQSGLGMGIAFDELDSDQRLTLKAWLADSNLPQQPIEEAAPGAQKGTAVAQRSQHVVLARLVHLMIHKGILTEAEGASILKDPVFF